MTNRISIPALRDLADSTTGKGVAIVSAPKLSALVEAVEAAHAYDIEQRTSGDPWALDGTSLEAALARFDFGEQT